MCDWNHQRGLKFETFAGNPPVLDLHIQCHLHVSPGRMRAAQPTNHCQKFPQTFVAAPTWWAASWSPARSPDEPPQGKNMMVFSSIAWYGDTVNNHEQPNILKNVVNKKQDIQFSISCHSWHIHCFDAGQPGSCGWTRQCLLLHDHLYPTNWTKHEDLHLWQTQMTWGKFTWTMDESPCRRTVEKRHCCLESWTSHMHFGGLKDSSNHHCQSPRSKQIDSRHPHVAWNTERHWWIGPISDSGLRRLWWPTLVHRFLPKFQALEHLGRLQLATIGVFHQCNRIR